MFSALGLEISKRVERIVPDPFVIAIGLTLLTAIIMVATGMWMGIGLVVFR